MHRYRYPGFEVPPGDADVDGAAILLDHDSLLNVKRSARLDGQPS
jgi:hypothetical protein